MNFLKGLIYLSPIFLLAELDHLILSELVLTPNDGEYVIITNPTDKDVDLSNYYLTDGTDVSNGKAYYKLPGGSDYWSGAGTDFICRFPDGYTLSAGSSVILSLRDSLRFTQTYGTIADLTLNENMLNAVNGVDSKGNDGAPKLDNTSETLILFYWDGTTSVIKDVDYLLWGGNPYALDKSSVNGYSSDTPVSNQSFFQAHLTDEKLVRTNGEGSETQSGGNGITGHDETSEPLSDTWKIVPAISSKPIISNITVTPAAPDTESEMTFTATVTDEDGLAKVRLITIFKTDSTRHTMNSVNGTEYTFNMSATGEVGTLYYYVYAEDNKGVADSTNYSSLSISQPTMELSIKALLDNLDNYVGKTIEIDGVITIAAGKLRTNFTEAYLQDESERGIILYNSSLDTSFKRADSVRVTAEVDEFDGKPELIYSNITVLKENAVIPVVELSIADFNSLDYTYTFVKVWGKIISRSEPAGTNTGANISLQDASGEVTTVRIWNSTNILYNDNFEIVNPTLDSLLQVGAIIEVAGIGGEYSGATQLALAYREDINEKLEGESGDFRAILNVAPYPFVPQIGEVIAYSYSFPANGRIKLRVFDLAGRLITTLYDEYRGISFYKEATWSGRDHLNRLVPPGTYIIHLDVKDSVTGKHYHDMAPVVIGIYGN